MNETTLLLKDYRSDRSFIDQAIDNAVLDEIILCAQRAPSSANAQHNSVIVVKDPETRKRISALCGGQPWIADAPVFLAIVVDFHKTAVALEVAGATQVIHQHIEGTIAASTDAGIILGAILTAARSLGLGTVPIGGVRANTASMGALLGLPEQSMVLVGVALGRVDIGNPRKPRLPMSTFRHDENYNRTAIVQSVAAYDEQLLAHWQASARVDGQAWSESIASYYARNYRLELKQDMLSAGIDTQ
ncbi:nitroreductase family protein [Pseudomonas gingeri]|uniref:nitroreductase family protein n=1 Tax=Pseudomonas gingeri TaxID=117681 RepID=UPI0015A37EC4|nr:nitroreductase family protein [Pseudomonas gingeri]NWD71787.1 nitroreductase family protein [Pseudomonas gingeri]